MTLSRMWAEPDAYDVIQQRRFEFMLGWFSPEKDEEGIKAFVQTAAHTHYARLLRDVFDSAKAYAKDNGMSPDDFKGPLNQAAELCHDLRAACSYYKAEDDTKLDFSPPSNIRLDNLKYLKMAAYSRDEIEPYVETYLRLPFRSPVMERTLAGLLMFYETSHLAEEMYRRAKGPFSRSPFKRHVLASTLMGLLVTIVVFGGAAFLAGYLNERGKMSAAWAEWIIIGSLGLLVVIAAWEICVLPFAWRRQYRARRRVSGMMMAMADFV